MPRGWAAHWFPSSSTAPGTGRELRKHEVNEWRGLRVGVLVLLLEALLPGVGVGGRRVPGMGPYLEALLVPRPCLVFSSPGISASGYGSPWFESQKELQLSCVLVEGMEGGERKGPPVPCAFSTLCLPPSDERFLRLPFPVSLKWRWRMGSGFPRALLCRAWAKSFPRGFLEGELGQTGSFPPRAGVILESERREGHPSSPWALALGAHLCCCFHKEWEALGMIAGPHPKVHFSCLQGGVCFLGRLALVARGQSGDGIAPLCGVGSSLVMILNCVGLLTLCLFYYESITCLW